MSSGPMAHGLDKRQGVADSILDRSFMTESKPTHARARLAPAGLIFLAITTIGWGSIGRSANICSPHCRR
jgi:hypothetical protein